MRTAIACLLVVVPLFVRAAVSDLRPAEMQQDFDVLRSALEEAHGGLYRYMPKPALDHRFSSVRAGLDHPMPRLAFIARVAEAVALVGDGHMRLEYDQATNTALRAARVLPLRVASEGGRLIVTSNDSRAHDTIKPGMELLSINGRAVADIVKGILPKLSGDGFIETGKVWRMARGFAQNYWLFVEQASTFAVTARNRGGATVAATLDGITEADRSKVTNPVNGVFAANLAALEGSKDVVSLGFPRGDDVAVLRIRAFDGDAFPSSIAAAFATLRQKRVQSLVLDLRGNGGGVDLYGAQLVSQFVSAPFRYFDHIRLATIRPSFATFKSTTLDNLKNGTMPDPGGGFLVLPSLHAGVAEQQPAAQPFLGRLAVLIDGGSFSTTADVCAQLRSLTKAMFVGGETGGAAEGNTSGLNAQVVLPHSGLRLKIHMYGYWNAARAGAHGRGTLPDAEAVRTTADVLAGTDSALTRAIALAKR